MELSVFGIAKQFGHIDEGAVDSIRLRSEPNPEEGGRGQIEANLLLSAGEPSGGSRGAAGS
jgi:hypothetical protein